jgi:hypothetical protein
MAQQYVAYALVSLSAAALFAVLVISSLILSNDVSSSVERSNAVRVSANPPRVALRFSYAFSAYAPALVTSAVTLATVLLLTGRLGAPQAPEHGKQWADVLVYALSVTQSVSLALYACASIPVEILAALVFIVVVRHSPREERMRAPVAWTLAIAHAALLAALFARERRRSGQSTVYSAAFTAALVLVFVRDASNVAPRMPTLARFEGATARIALAVATQACILMSLA